MGRIPSPFLLSEMKRLFLFIFIALLLSCQPLTNMSEHEKLDALIYITPNPSSPSFQGTIEKHLNNYPNISKNDESNKDTLSFQWKESIICDNKKSIRIDAAITIPIVSSWSVYSVDHVFWKAEDIELICKNFAKKQPIYAGTYTPTKAYFSDLFPKIRDNEKTKELNRWLSELNEPTIQENLILLHEAAPELIAPQLTNWEKYHEFGEGSPLLGYYYNPSLDSYINLYINAEKTMISFFSFDNLIQNEDIVRQGEYVGANPGRELNNLSISLDDACEIAESLFATIGVQNVSLSELETKKAQRVNMYTSNVESEGWQLVYRHSVNNIPCISSNQSLASKADTSFSQEWAMELITLYVDNNGIWSFSWSNPCTLNKKISDQPLMIGFDKIQQAIILNIQSDFVEGITEIRITDIQLGYSMLYQNDVPEKVYAIPIWVINYEADASFSPAPLYYGFSIIALNGERIHPN